MKRRNFAVFAAAIVVFCFSLSVSGAHDVAEVSIGSSGIYWQPKVSYSQVTLSVSCPGGEVFQKTFKGGTAPYFDLADIKGQLFDGSYTYELRVTPLDAQKKREDGNSPKKKMSGQTLRLKSLTQTGYFTVSGGAIVTPGAVAERRNRPAVTQGDPARPSDQVILDDLIVDGSICAGFDCINGEAFGFDTLILKENNLRIFFRDTSSSASFPSNDWRITVNDSANGGANKFSIDDVDGGRTPFTIEASAPSNSIYVDDGGRVGFGKATPVADLHVATGNTPTLRLEQDGSSGFTPQTWDVAGNEANFFIRDATNGSNLPFRIIPGAPSNTLYLNSNGKVGIGTDSPQYLLHVKNTGANSNIIVERDGYAKIYMHATDTHANIGSITDHPLRFVANNQTRLYISTDGKVGINGHATTDPAYKLTVYANNTVGSTYGYSDGAGWNTGSKREFKENIKDLEAADAMAAFRKLNPVRYHYKDIENGEHLGFIAEDVPEIVATKKRDAINAMDIVSLLTKVVQEQQKAVEKHEKTIAELKKELAKLKKNR